MVPENLRSNSKGRS